ncbi:uncharacterized protein PODANS_6_150 [Podospora anserina S mat+]|uniref:Podospora anserina S mat+ genomic DNA chromosome 6, supercontig 2 n=1 Tax=Podospora anserina (strain S / ATCC MYA-4624 / DSM 980 / FGSC 10383) TaxID=515849 RepID=B2B3F6_PODAN|nr:uncharacterized protein PODANS_6_150 [Podospora anserina S mat+]CAP71642.1 unnamed protein product [Podospora anserina S mat+]CDP31035.1 Putative protein of unknown function [Podospora anserina S mat+]
MAHSSPSMQPSVQLPSPQPLDDQPGLEVVPHDNLPEVRPEEEPKFYLSPAQYQDQKIVLGEDYPQVVDGNGEIEVGSPASTEKGTLPPVSKSYQRRKWWIIGGTACAVVAIVVGVTLGVVLSLKARNNDGNAAINGTSGPETIRQGSKLSAAGWRKANGYVERYLFYLDPQGQIRRSRSITGKGNSTSTWEVLPVLDLKATNGTSLAATIALHGTDYNPQTALFYEADRKVFGTMFNQARQPNILIDNVSGGYSRGFADLAMGNAAKLAAYWPYVVAQHETGDIIQVDHMLGDGLVPTEDWYVQNLNITAYEGSSLCIVPTSSNFTEIKESKAYGVVYQKPNQGLAIHYPAFEPGTPDAVQLERVPETFPELYTFPPQTPMAAFAVPRGSNDNDSLVDIYLVIKSYTGKFAVWFSENSSSWREEFPAVFQEVDEDSDIACSTLAVTNMDWEGKEVPLERGEVRCYFQRNGIVVEVAFEGLIWTEVGVVPIP